MNSVGIEKVLRRLMENSFYGSVVTHIHTGKQDESDKRLNRALYPKDNSGKFKKK